jgi:hypothetical protein
MLILGNPYQVQDQSQQQQEFLVLLYKPSLLLELGQNQLL